MERELVRVVFSLSINLFIFIDLASEALLKAVCPVRVNYEHQVPHKHGQYYRHDPELYHKELSHFIFTLVHRADEATFLKVTVFVHVVANLCVDLVAGVFL